MSGWPFSQVLVRSLLVVVTWPIIVFSAPSTAGAEPALGETPYRVEITTGVGSGSAIDHRDCEQALQAAGSRAWGRSWDCTWQRDRGTTPTEPNRTAYHNELPDVQIGIWHVHRGGLHVGKIRLRQARLDYDSGWYEFHTLEPREWSTLAVARCVQLFRPWARISQASDTDVRLHVQGRDLMLETAPALLPAAGSFWRASLEFRDGNGQRIRRIDVPWTYLELQPDEPEQTYGVAKITSGLRKPLGARTRGRVEIWASLAQPIHSTTEVLISSTGKEARPLAMHQVELFPWESPPRMSLEAHSTQRSVLTSRQGTVVLPQETSGRPTWLLVWSGKSKLARVPFLAGVDPRVTLELPDDRLRLEAENELNLIEADLIDAVARRGALIAAIRRDLKKNRLPSAAALRRELDRLPTRDMFRARVAGVRVPAIEAARASKNRSAEGKISRLCDEVMVLIDRHLGGDRIKLLDEELDEINKVDQESRKLEVLDHDEPPTSPSSTSP